MADNEKSFVAEVSDAGGGHPEKNKKIVLAVTNSSEWVG